MMRPSPDLAAFRDDLEQPSVLQYARVTRERAAGETEFIHELALGQAASSGGQQVAVERQSDRFRQGDKHRLWSVAVDGSRGCVGEGNAHLATLQPNRPVT